MPRPSKNGEAARAARKRVLTEFAITKVKPEASGAYNLWDARERGLALRVQRSGFRSFKFVYSFRGRPRWYHIGWVPLSEARRIAVKLRLSVAEGRDPVAERAAERGAGTFAELADAYLEAAESSEDQTQVVLLQGFAEKAIARLAWLRSLTVA